MEKNQSIGEDQNQPKIQWGKKKLTHNQIHKTYWPYASYGSTPSFFICAMAISKMGKKVKLVPITLSTPDPMYILRPKMPSVKGKGMRMMLMMEQIPLVMSAAAMAYCCESTSVKAMVKRKTTNGGVMRPPTMAKACCSPMSADRNTGRGSSKKVGYRVWSKYGHGCVYRCVGV